MDISDKLLLPGTEHILVDPEALRLTADGEVRGVIVLHDDLHDRGLLGVRHLLNLAPVVEV